MQAVGTRAKQGARAWRRFFGPTHMVNEAFQNLVLAGMPLVRVLTHQQESNRRADLPSQPAIHSQQGGVVLPHPRPLCTSADLTAEPEGLLVPWWLVRIVGVTIVLLGFSVVLLAGCWFCHGLRARRSRHTLQQRAAVAKRHIELLDEWPGTVDVEQRT